MMSSSFRIDKVISKKRKLCIFRVPFNLAIFIFTFSIFILSHMDRRSDCNSAFDWVQNEIDASQKQTKNYNDNLDDMMNEADFCGCSGSVSSAGFANSTCGVSAFLRGAKQRVVSFAFYGHNDSQRLRSKNYYEGIQRNLELMRKFYPGFVMRLHLDLDPNSSLAKSICNLACSSHFLDICDIQHLPGTPIRNASTIFPLIWRFFPSLDPQVDVLLSRDLDSLIGEQEARAVMEWLESNKSLHVMRDHPAHNMGGVFGLNMATNHLNYPNYDKNDKNSTKNDENINKSADIRALIWQSWRDASEDIIMQAPRSSIGFDQVFLRRYLWPWLKKDSMQHKLSAIPRYNWFSHSKH